MTTRIRRKITQAEVLHHGRPVTLTLMPDGLHIREKFARDERVIPLVELVKASVTRAERCYKPDSVAERLQVTACDLAELSWMIRNKSFERTVLPSIVKSIRQAQQILKALEVASD